MRRRIPRILRPSRRVARIAAMAAVAVLVFAIVPPKLSPVILLPALGYLVGRLDAARRQANGQAKTVRQGGARRRPKPS